MIKLSINLGEEKKKEYICMLLFDQFILSLSCLVHIFAYSTCWNQLLGGCQSFQQVCFVTAVSGKHQGILSKTERMVLCNRKKGHKDSTDRQNIDCFTSRKGINTTKSSINVLSFAHCIGHVYW